MSRSISTILVTSLLLAGAAARTGAQDPLSVSNNRFSSLATYLISFPVGDTHRYVPSVSWMGLGWEGQWALRQNAAAGMMFTMNDFYDRSTGTTNFTSGSATGRQQRDLLFTTFMATGRWYAAGIGARGPYLGLGAGGSYGQQSYQLGVASEMIRSGFHLAFAPEAGMSIPVFDGVDAMMSVRYTMQTPTGRYLGGGSRTFPYVSLTFGLSER